SCSLLYLHTPRPPRTTLFPYTTLFRSRKSAEKPTAASDENLPPKTPKSIDKQAITNINEPISKTYCISFVNNPLSNILAIKKGIKISIETSNAKKSMVKKEGFLY